MPKQTNDFQQLIAMVVELLEDGAVVEESRLFPDPDTGVKREVDVYALVRGKANQKVFAIAVECVDRSRKMDVTWVEGIYGKHSVLQVADVVLLVSAKGFYHSAEVKAKRFGYKTISPAISAKRLATTIFGTDGHGLGVTVGHMNLVGVQAQMSAAGLTPDFTMVESDVSVCAYRRADGMELVKANKYAMDAAVKKITEDAQAFMAEQASDETTIVTVDEPALDGERLHVLMRSADGETELLAVLDRLAITVRFSATGMTNHTLTHGGDFDGADFATGTGQVGNYPSRFTMVNTLAGPRGMLRPQYYIPSNPAARRDGPEGAARGWACRAKSRHSIVGEVAVHGGAGDSQHLRDVGGRDALLPELAGFGGIGVVDLAWASTLAPVGCGSGQPGAGALDHGVAFELGEGGHDGEHGCAHRPVGVQTFGEAAESDPSGRQLVHHGENVLGVASEAVELPDGEHVAFAEMVEAGIEMGSAGCRAAHAMVGVDAGRPGFLKRVELKLGILVGGADSRVPDNRHYRAPLSHNPVELSVLILPVMRLVFKTSDRRR